MSKDHKEQAGVGVSLTSRQKEFLLEICYKGIVFGIVYMLLITQLAQTHPVFVHQIDQDREELSVPRVSSSSVRSTWLAAFDIMSSQFHRSLTLSDVETMLNAALSSVDDNGGYLPSRDSGRFFDRNPVLGDDGPRAPPARIGTRNLVSEEGVWVRDVFPGSPADVAGVKRGERFVSVGEVSLDGFAGPAAMELLLDVITEHGSENPSPLSLLLENSEGVVREVSVFPGVVQGSSVFSRGIEAGVLVVGFEEFQFGSSRALQTVLSQALANRDKEPFDTLIVDLRNNYGGIVDEAVAAADLFLPAHFPVMQKVQRGDVVTSLYTNLPPLMPDDVSVVVFVNENSASASEIFASALSESGRAILVGDVTYGKGSVQTLFQTSLGGSLRLTSGRYLTSGGVDLEKEGLRPDVFVPVDLRNVSSAQVAPWEVDPWVLWVFSDDKKEAAIVE